MDDGPTRDESVQARARDLPRRNDSTFWGKPRPTVSADRQVQSLVEAALAGVDAGAAGVVEVLPESPDEDEEDDDDESVEVDVDDDADDFDLPPRLSVL